MLTGVLSYLCEGFVLPGVLFHMCEGVMLACMRVSCWQMYCLTCVRAPYWQEWCLTFMRASCRQVYCFTCVRGDFASCKKNSGPVSHADLPSAHPLFVTKTVTIDITCRLLTQFFLYLQCLKTPFSCGVLWKFHGQNKAKSVYFIFSQCSQLNMMTVGLMFSQSFLESHYYFHFI